jgi:hypothetical protein
MEGSYKYFEQAVAGSRQGAIFRLGGLDEGLTIPLCKKKKSSFIRNVTQGLGFGWIVWNDVGNVKKVKVKGKVVSVLHLTEHHAMKAYWGVVVQLHPFFDLGTRRR